MDKIHLGNDAKTGEPFYLPRHLFELGHLHSRGFPGEGKSTAAADVISQLMEVTDAGGRSAIFIINLCIDYVFKWLLQMKATECGRKFRTFSLEESDHFFEPLSRASGLSSSVSQLADWLNNALGKQHGFGYGQGFFSGENLWDVRTTLEKLVRRGIDRPTIRQFAEEVERKRYGKQGTEIRSAAVPLMEYKQLDFADDPERQIDIERAIRDAEVVYFELDSLSYPNTSEIIAGLALGLIVAETEQRFPENGPHEHVYVAIDEFGRIAGPRFEPILTAIRKHQASMLLLNQSTSQLRHRHSGLEDVVFESTRIKQYWSCVGDDVDVLRSLSEETTRPLGGMSGIGMGITESWREVVDRKLSVNEILDCTGTAREFFLVWNDGLGHHEPLRLRAPEVPAERLAKATELAARHRAQMNQKRGETGQAAKRMPPVLTDAEQQDWSAVVTSIFDEKLAAEMIEQ